MTEIELTGLNEVLDLIDSYFDDRADADQEPGDAYPIGNEEMGLLTQLRRERARLSVSATPNRTGGVGAEPAPVAYRYRDRANGPNERWIYVEMLDGREGFVLKSVLNRPEEYEAVPLYASPAIPADHVVVPREPTLAMSMAGEAEYVRRGLGVWSNFHAIYRAMLAAAPSAPASPPVGDGWRDIATAPKDKTKVLVCKPGEGPIIAHQTGMGVWVNSFAGHANKYRILEGDDSPTHWQPLPSPTAPPSTEGAQDGR